MNGEISHQMCAGKSERDRKWNLAVRIAQINRVAASSIRAHCWRRDDDARRTINFDDVRNE